MKKQSHEKPSESQVEALAEIEHPSAPLPKLVASPIPQVEARPEVSTVVSGGAPADEDYAGGIFTMTAGAWIGEDFALCIHAPDTYERTHSLKNSLHFWQGKAEEFRKTFEKK